MMERKLKPNTVFINHGDGCRMLRALLDYRAELRGEENLDHDLFRRVSAAARALQNSILETVETAYEPGREFEVTAEALEPRKVTVRVCAENSDDALEKGYDELHDAYTAAIDFRNLDAKEIKEG